MESEPPIGPPVDVVTAVLADADEVMVTTRRPDLIAAMVAALAASADPPSVRIVAPSSTLDQSTDDFVVATRMAEVVASGDLALRTVETVEQDLLVTPTHVVSIVSLDDDRVGGITATTDWMIATLWRRLTRRFDGADRFELSTTQYSRVRDTLDTHLSVRVRSDVATVFEAVDDSRRSADLIDEIDIVLLIGARHGALLSDVAEWAESIGVASRATVSNRKQRLVRADLVDTDRVPHGVGRPRQRLVLGAAAPEMTTPAELVETARHTLD